MPTHSSSGSPLSPELYWRLRRRELANLVQQTELAVQRTRDYQKVLVIMWGDAKSNQPEWDDQVAGAKQAIRAARAKRTSLRRMVGNLNDTIRIRPHLRDALPDDMRESIDAARRMCDYMDAHGY